MFMMPIFAPVKSRSKYQKLVVSWASWAAAFMFASSLPVWAQDKTTDTTTETPIVNSAMDGELFFKILLGELSLVCRSVVLSNPEKVASFSQLENFRQLSSRLIVVQTIANHKFGSNGKTYKIGFKGKL